MAWAGKLIGGGLGWAMFGPLGALFGGMIGNIFDQRGRAREIPYNYYRNAEYVNSHQESFQRNLGGNFAVALLALCAHVIRADRRVLSSEVRKVREFLVAQFGQDNAQDMLKMLRQILEREFDVSEICAQITAHMGYHDRLEILHFLFTIAMADGELHPEETRAVQEIARRLGISEEDLRAVFGSSRPAGGPAAASSHYEVLGMNPSAADEELKRAYRELAKKFHPDRVAHLGDEYRSFAEEKFKNLQHAWSAIRKERKL